MTAVVSTAIVSAIPAPAKSERSAWVKGDHSELRLIHAGTANDGALIAGIEIRLDPDWKTYWRYPGDSGIPPRFDFSASKNVASVEVHYPAPVRFEDSGGQSIGYKIDVIFPLTVTPRDPEAPVILNGLIDYAVCANICIPVFAESELDLSEAPRDSDTLRVQSFLDTVPGRLPEGDARGIVAVSVDPEAVPPALTLVADFGDGTSAPDLFVEGPMRWYVGLPEPVGVCETGLCTFGLDLYGVEAEAVSGAELTVTGVSSRFSFEQVLALP
ncbi:MAG: protein-disulfide reductase DsbD domain-containing protein [Pseudomonadota bacterium]